MILGIRLLQIWPHSVVCVHNYYGEVSFPGKNTNLIIEIIIIKIIMFNHSIFSLLLAI